MAGRSRYWLDPSRVFLRHPLEGVQLIGQGVLQIDRVEAYFDRHSAWLEDLAFHAGVGVDQHTATRHAASKAARHAGS